MPELEVTVGGRGFSVSCQPGEEHFLRAAAKVLDIEAQPLVTQLGRLPEARMLLMAGLMLADRTAALEDELRVVKSKLAEVESRPVADREIVEVPVVPAEITATLADLAVRAEAMAARVEEQLAG